MHIEEKNNIKNIIFDIIGTIIGAFIMAIGVSLFLLPNQLSSGGIAGIATITYYLFNIPMGTMILIINVPLFLLSIYKIGKMFFIKSLIGTVSLSVFIDILDRIEPLTHDRFLACVYGGIIIGLGTAMILDTIIVILNIVFFREIEIGLYSAIAIYLMGKIIDIVFEGTYFTKLILIVSEQNEEIAKEIEEKIQRGATGLYGKGMYTNKEKLVLMCAASRRDVARIKIIARKLDPSSFIIITNSREVVGLGFKKS